MRFSSGKQSGKTYEEVVLKSPDFVQFVLDAQGDTKTTREMKRLIAEFDDKPFTATCQGHECENVATRTSVYNGHYAPMFWCDDCNPYGTGAVAGKLTIITDYESALRHVDNYAKGKRDWKKGIIKELAQGKGLSKRVTEAKAVEFFE